MKNLSDTKIFPGESDNDIREVLDKFDLRIEVSGGRIKIAADGASHFGFMIIMADLLKALTKAVEAVEETTKDKAISRCIVGSGIFVYLEDELQLEPWRMFTDQKPDCLKALDDNELADRIGENGGEREAKHAKENKHQ